MLATLGFPASKILITAACLLFLSPGWRSSNVRQPPPFGLMCTCTAFAYPPIPKMARASCQGPPKPRPTTERPRQRVPCSDDDRRNIVVLSMEERQQHRRRREKNPEDQDELHLFIFGLGNVGRAVADMAASLEEQQKTNDDDGRAQRALRFRTISGTVTRVVEEEASTPASDGTVVAVESILFHDRPRIATRLARATHVLVTVPIVRTDDDDDDEPRFLDPVLHGRYDEHVRPGAWVGYVSTTGVYGHHDGAWVDETTTPTGAAPKAAAYARSERAWAAHASRGRWRSLVVFRCAGLYGHHTSALHTVLRTRRPSDGSVTVAPRAAVPTHETSTWYTSRIHLTDVGRAILASMLLLTGGQEESERHEKRTTVDDDERDQDRIAAAAAQCSVYNLADDEPCPRATAMAFANDLLLTHTDDAVDLSALRRMIHKNGTTTTTTNTTTTSSDAATKRARSSARAPNDTTSDRTRRRKTDNKRVSNTKMKTELLQPYYGEGLMLPTYREGLASVLEHLIDKSKDDGNRAT